MKAIIHLFSGNGNGEETLAKGLGLSGSGDILARMPFDISIE
jgi:hypothetical protein